MKTKEPKILTMPEALEKLRHFCGYQERSRKQVKEKMVRLLLPPEWEEPLFQALEEEQFLNDDRYAQAFVRGKSRIKGWGPRKIAQHLQFETGREVNLTEVLQKEDQAKALDKLAKDLSKKALGLQSKKDPDLKGKLIRFCLSRGFDMDDAIRSVKSVLGSAGK